MKGLFLHPHKALKLLKHILIYFVFFFEVYLCRKTGKSEEVANECKWCSVKTSKQHFLLQNRCKKHQEALSNASRFRGSHVIHETTQAIFLGTLRRCDRWWTIKKPLQYKLETWTRKPPKSKKNGRTINHHKAPKSTTKFRCLKKPPKNEKDSTAPGLEECYPGSATLVSFRLCKETTLLLQETENPMISTFLTKNHIARVLAFLVLISFELSNK